MITVQRYRATRFWAVYDAGDLVCVAVYKKGAIEVKARLEQARVSNRVTEISRPISAESA